MLNIMLVIFLRKISALPIYDDDYLNNAPEEQNDMPFEMHDRIQVINSEILNEVVDISFENCHENSLHGS